MYQRIFVPVDSSTQSELALDEAIDMAKALGSTLILAHSVDLPQYGTGNPERMDSFTMEHPLMDEGQDLLKNACDHVRQAGLEPESRLLENHGDKTAELLLAVAGECNAELIVMGTHGRTGLTHLLMGSVAEGMLREANVPILLVRSGTVA
jgi:nucleotide-binding universal stress UspA family protein